MAVMIARTTQIYCRFHKELTKNRSKSPRCAPRRRRKLMAWRTKKRKSQTILPVHPRTTCSHFHRLSRKERKCPKLQRWWMIAQNRSSQKLMMRTRPSLPFQMSCREMMALQCTSQWILRRLPSNKQPKKSCNNYKRVMQRLLSPVWSTARWLRPWLSKIPTLVRCLSRRQAHIPWSTVSKGHSRNRNKRLILIKCNYSNL